MRAKPPKWQAKQTPATNNKVSTSTNAEENQQKQSSSSSENSPMLARIPSPDSLAVPDETDLRPGIKNNGRQASPNVLRRRFKQQHEQQQQQQQQQQQTEKNKKFLKNHKRTVSLQEIIQEDKSCQNIPEVGIYYNLHTSRSLGNIDVSRPI